MLYLKDLILLCLLVIVPLATHANAQDIKLIANPDVQVDALSAADVKNIFLGKKTNWDNGAKITFFISEETATHKAFLKSYVGESAARYKKIWRRRVFSGRGKAPKSSSSDKEMVDLVSKNSGAIGYVSAQSDAGRSKILSVK